MLPTDANFTGNVFGGRILEEIDLVAGIAAARHSKSTCVTASFDRVDFIQPVHVGDVVDFDAELTYVGTTSMEVLGADHRGGDARRRSARGRGSVRDDGRGR